MIEDDVWGGGTTKRHKANRGGDNTGRRVSLMIDPRSRDRPANAIDDFDGFVDAPCAAPQQELFASDAKNVIVIAAEFRFENLRHMPQHLVTGSMSIVVVVGLEVVDIEHRDTFQKAIAVAAGQTRKHLRKCAAVGQADQGVDHR